MPSPRRSPEVPFVRSARQKIGFTSRQRSSILMAPMLTRLYVPLRTMAMVLEAQAFLTRKCP